MKRYRKHGPGKRFVFSVMAPLPQLFIDVCDKFQLPLQEEHVNGGIWVDGERRQCGTLHEVDGGGGEVAVVRSFYCYIDTFTSATQLMKCLFRINETCAWVLAAVTFTPSRDTRAIVIS